MFTTKIKIFEHKKVPSHILFEISILICDTNMGHILTLYEIYTEKKISRRNRSWATQKSSHVKQQNLFHFKHFFSCLHFEYAA